MAAPSAAAQPPPPNATGIAPKLAIALMGVVGTACAALLALKLLAQPYHAVAALPPALLSIAVSVGVSLVGGVATYALIPVIAPQMIRAGMTGRDLHKPADPTTKQLPVIPEAMGLVPATVFLVCLIIFATLQNSASPEYFAALTSICFMILLGFVDDTLDLRWRYKLILPLVATLPLLLAYSGPTFVVVPKLLRPLMLLGSHIVDLGIFYKWGYMMSLAIFATNAINIYAGVNGLESGQSLVIACAVLVHNALELLFPSPTTAWGQHLFSLLCIMPFITTTAALFLYNRFPARVFVGDTFTYFAGMTLAVVGILGHFSKTLLLFFLPQILNFVLSIPQLVGIKPCPRHRLPRYDPDRKVLHTTWPQNNTLINLYLYLVGPMSEKQLGEHLLVLQATCCVLGLFVRYVVSEWFF